MCRHTTGGTIICSLLDLILVVPSPMPSSYSTASSSLFSLVYPETFMDGFRDLLTDSHHPFYHPTAGDGCLGTPFSEGGRLLVIFLLFMTGNSYLSPISILEDSDRAHNGLPRE